MKTKLRLIPRISSLTLIIFAFFNCQVFVAAQTDAESKDVKLLPPAEEKFQEATDLVAPWRSSGCSEINREFREPNCYVVTPKEWRSSDVLTLYNKDGLLWYQFSVNPANSNHFLRNIKKEFLPFATYLSGPDAVILRMIGESSHWYEVEINEETRETKFVLKSDPMWAKTKWIYWLYEIKFLKFNDEQQSLLDKPDGKVIEASSDLQFYHFRFLKADGDWAYVEGIGLQKLYYGWIRWRKGRDMLIKSSNGLVKFAETKINAENK